MDFEEGLNSAWNDVASFVPKLAAFLLILLIGWLIAKALAKVTNGVLERVGFDNAVERGGIRTALAKTSYDASDLVAKFVYYTLILVTLQMAFGVFGPNPVSELLTSIISWLPQAVIAIIIIVVAAAIANAVRDLVSSALSGLSYGRLLGNLAGGFILALGVIAALNQIGIATAVTTPILIAVLATIGGVVIVGVGGGLVRPMQEVWQGWIGTIQNESNSIRHQIDLRKADGQVPPRSGATCRDGRREPVCEPSHLSRAGEPGGRVHQSAGGRALPYPNWPPQPRGDRCPTTRSGVGRSSSPTTCEQAQLSSRRRIRCAAATGRW